MKITTVVKVVAIGLVLVFIAGPVAAAPVGALESLGFSTDSRESSKLSAFMSSAQYSLLEGKFAKPNTSVFSSGIPKSTVIQIDVPQKSLWKDIPSTGPYCPTCSFTNASNKFGAMFTEDYKSQMGGFFFGGGGGGAPAGGGGCCG